MGPMPESFESMLGVTPQDIQAQQPAMLNDKKLLNYQQVPSLWGALGLLNLMGLTGRAPNPSFGPAMYPRKIRMDALNPSTGQDVLDAYPHGYREKPFPATSPQQQAMFQAMPQALREGRKPNVGGGAP